MNSFKKGDLVVLECEQCSSAWTCRNVVAKVNAIKNIGEIASVDFIHSGRKYAGCLCKISARHLTDRERFLHLACGVTRF